MASKNGQDAVLTAALSSGTKLELNCVQADQNVEIVDKIKAGSVYKLVRWYWSQQLLNAKLRVGRQLLRLASTTQSAQR